MKPKRRKLCQTLRKNRKEKRKERMHSWKPRDCCLLQRKQLRSLNIHFVEASTQVLLDYTGARKGKSTTI
jgi:hypothetical protein